MINHECMVLENKSSTGWPVHQSFIMSGTWSTHTAFLIDWSFLNDILGHLDLYKKYDDDNNNNNVIYKALCDIQNGLNAETQTIQDKKLNKV